jgi:predicted outer membrane repeat protein
MKSLIFLVLSICAILTPAFAQNYTAQPFYQDGKIRFYNTTSGATINPSTVAYTLDVSADMVNVWGQAANASNGPNSVVIYNNKIFVSFDMNGSKGGVLVYDYANIFPSRNAVAPAVLKPGGGNGSACAGMTINPANGDLYICSYTGGAGNGGIYYATAASNYTALNNLSDYSHPSVDTYCANIAFDANNNLWFTTWNDNADPAQMYLVCYKNLNKANYYKVINTATKSYSATSTGGVTKMVHLLSAPEGLVFDPTGNLWLGNNNDYNAVNAAGDGTLVKINSSWLNNTLLAGGAGSSMTVPAAQASIKYIPSGKLGGLAISGNKLYVNDQGQTQGSSFTTSGTVWKYDVTTTFNAANFVASGIRTTYPGNGQMAFASSISAPAAPTKLYVKANANGANNGTSWANAYTNLQDALNNTTIDTIFVAAGTYYPTAYPPNCVGCNSTRYNTFSITSTHKLFGDFVGTETQLAQRTTTANHTSILSGNVGSLTDYLDNSLRLFTVLSANNIRFDGFMMTEVWANIFCNTITTNNIVIKTGYGGGMYLHLSTGIVIENCYIYDVSGRDICGGSILNSFGGAVYNNQSTLTVNNSNIQNCSAGFGGAIYTSSGGTTNITKSIFSGNAGEGGGALYYASGSTGAINNSYFRGNDASKGGVIYTYGSAISNINSCVFNGNFAYGNGGVIYANDLRTNIRNSTFYANTINQSTIGKGACVFDTTFTNPAGTATFVNNIFYNSSSSNPNTAGRLHIYSHNTNGTTRIRTQYNLIADDAPLTNIVDLGSNLLGANYNPQFIDPANDYGADQQLLTADDGLRINCITSNALNTGTTTLSAPTTDILGNARQGNPDLGAYEATCTTNNIYQTNANTCQFVTVNNVSGNNWFHFSNANGIIASINPNGANLGNVTASVSDPSGAVTLNNKKFLGRTIGFTSTVAPVIPYTLRLYFKDTEITEYQTATGQAGLDKSSFNVAWASGGTSCVAGGFTGNTGGVVPANNGVVAAEYGANNEGFYLQVMLNHFTIFAATTDTQTNVLVNTEDNAFINADLYANIYPNPVADEMTIELKGDDTEGYKVQLYDMVGRCVSTNIPIQNNQAIINTHELPANIYNLVITHNDKVILNKRVVKQ